MTPAPNRPIIVTALFGQDDFAWLEGLRRTHYPAERNRVPAHLTLFSHLPPGIERELAQRLAEITDTPPPRARISGILDLDGGTAFLVDSEELEEMRSELAFAFHGLLTPQDGADWRPHVTIQNKVDRREARELQTTLRRRFQPQPLSIKGLASWSYDEGSWLPLKSHAFRR
jgi:hypothetical protein